MNKVRVLQTQIQKRKYVTLTKCLYLTNRTPSTEICSEIDLASGYNPQDVELNKYIEWEHNKKFSPKRHGSKRPFSIVLPPPNVTGSLHLGHALTATVQDVLARWHRLHRDEVVWVPGMDHAGIATQVVVEKQLLAETGQTRQQIGRDAFQKLVWKWKNDKGPTINNQLRKMGASLDWSREVFTLDSGQSEAVNEAFVRLFDRGLIYRADSLVNWCCHLQSAISDMEVQTLELSGPTDLSLPGYDKPVKFGVMTDFSYKLYNMEGEVVVSTTRLETLLGDVAIAISPKDPRYSALQGLKVWHPFRNETIPIVSDEYVDKEFGTGVVKITPAHDRNDFDLSQRHNLPSISVINEQGVMTEICGKFSGVKRYDARKLICDDLKALGLYRGEKGHAMSVPLCSRTGDVVEYMLKPQWFMKCDKMAYRAVQDVKDGRLIIDPPIFEKAWYQWLENIRDWCISRQLWWGHRIPAYESYHKSDPMTTVWVVGTDHAKALARACEVFNGSADDIELKQDTDVLDTWFSSALFPFSVHGWPKKTDALARYYPLTLMETGHDIMFFWVARMVMLGTELTDVLPFNKILLHGIICDSHGRKMSKSLGNVVAPEDIINGITLEGLNEQAYNLHKSGILTQEELSKTLQGQSKMFPKGIPACGTDALRFTLCSHNIKSHFINFDISECYTNKLFCNKIWQATRYIKMFMDKCRREHMHCGDITRSDLSIMDVWILSRLSSAIQIINDANRIAELHLSTAALKNFLYSEFCDIYIESTKPYMHKLTPTSLIVCEVLLLCLQLTLRYLSPYMPYLTEELLKSLPEKNQFVDIDLQTLQFPIKMDSWRSIDVENQVQILLDISATIRSLKASYSIPSKQKYNVYIKTSRDSKSTPVLISHNNIISSLSQCGAVTILSDLDKLPYTNIFDTVGTLCSVHIVVEGILKGGKIKDSKKQDKLLTDIEKMNSIMNNPGYKEKASQKVQSDHLKKLQQLEQEFRELQGFGEG